MEVALVDVLSSISDYSFGSLLRSSNYKLDTETTSVLPEYTADHNSEAGYIHSQPANGPPL